MFIVIFLFAGDRNYLSIKQSMKYGSLIIVTGLLVIAVIQINPEFKERIDISRTIEQKLSLSGASTEASHFKIIKRALEVSTESIKNLFFGIGFGASQYCLI